MAKLDDFQAAVTAAFDKLDTAHDGLAADVQFLKDEIAKLQASAGELTPEDQAIVDGLQARAIAMGEKFAALDELTTAPTP